VKARIRPEIGIEIGLDFDQSEERKPISDSVNFASIDQNPILIFNLYFDTGIRTFNRDWSIFFRFYGGELNF